LFKNYFHEILPGKAQNGSLDIMLDQLLVVQASLLWSGFFKWFFPY